MWPKAIDPPLVAAGRFVIGGCGLEKKVSPLKSVPVNSQRSEREVIRREMHGRALSSALWLAVVAAQEIGDGSLVETLGRLHAQAVTRQWSASA